MDDSFGSCLTTVVPIAIKLIDYYKNKKEERKSEWKVNIKYVDDMFYPCLLMICLIISAIITIFYDWLIEMRIGLGYRLILILIIWRVIIGITYRIKTVRLALLRTKARYKHLLIYLPIILSTIGIRASVYEKESQLCCIIYWICLFSLMICECVGLVTFFYSYTRYEYSFAKLYISEGIVIEDVKIETLNKKGKWIEYDNSVNKGRVLFDDVIRIEYYGEAKYVVRNILGKKYNGTII